MIGEFTSTLVIKTAFMKLQNVCWAKHANVVEALIMVLSIVNVGVWNTQALVSPLISFP
jgi:hypothetical protein